MEVFDQNQNIINYHGKKYPFRYVWYDDYKSNVVISVTSLNQEVFEKNGYWEDKLGEYIDNKIIFYVSESEINKPEKYLQTILKKM